MMGRISQDQGQPFYSFNLEAVVPDDHLVRAVARVLDLSWVRAELAPHYSHTGRPSIDPVLMIRMLIVGYIFAIRSERALCREVQLNLAYRWFCGLGIEDDIPDHSALYGPAAHRKRFSLICRMWVLHQCIRPHIGACHAPGHYGYQRACDLINVQASTGPTGPPVFARTGKTDPPSRLILSQTSSAGKSDRSDYVIAGSSFCAAAVIGGGE